MKKMFFLLCAALVVWLGAENSASASPPLRLQKWVRLGPGYNVPATLQLLRRGNGDSMYPGQLFLSTEPQVVTFDCANPNDDTSFVCIRAVLTDGHGNEVPGLRVRFQADRGRFLNQDLPQTVTLRLIESEFNDLPIFGYDFLVTASVEGFNIEADPVLIFVTIRR